MVTRLKKLDAWWNRNFTIIATITMVAYMILNIYQDHQICKLENLLAESGIAREEYKCQLDECKIDSGDWEQQCYDLTAQVDSLERLQDLSLDNFKIKEGTLTEDLDPRLVLAMMDYTGPQQFVTSMKRKKHPTSKRIDRGKHACGKAWDIRLDKGGVECFHWLVSKEGLEWRKKHNVRFLVEDTHWSSTMHKLFDDYHRLARFKINDRCTGAHIHIEIA